MAINNGSIYWTGNYQGEEYTEENPLEIEISSNEEKKEITVNIKASENEIIKLDESTILNAVNNSWAAGLGLTYNSGLPLKVTTTISSKLIGVSTLVSFQKDYKDGEPIDQAFISSLGEATTSWGASWLIGVGTAKALGLIGGVVSMPALLPVAIGIVVGIGAGYVGTKIGDKANEIIDELIFEDQILVEFGEEVKLNSLETWKSLKEMTLDFKGLIDQGVTNIQLKFDNWTGSLLDFIASEENKPHSYLLGGNEIKGIMAFYNSASTAQVIRRDPLVLDLDGDGLEIDPLGSGAHFDLDRNGFAEETAWINIFFVHSLLTQRTEPRKVPLFNSLIARLLIVSSFSSYNCSSV